MLLSIHRTAATSHSPKSLFLSRKTYEKYMKTTFFIFFCIFLPKNLVVTEKPATFAPAIEKHSDASEKRNKMVR